MTPFEIDILMHYYCSPNEHPVIAANPPIRSETFSKLIEAGLLVRHERPNNYGALYGSTDRNEAYIRALCNVPLPVQKWVMPE